ncbi:hypothetical protein DXB36_05060 [Dorea formicigenerans]|uniref:Uncharacterized protein n=1 Tax=Dorea formicigenerans TaxID=39486 RepID=A0A3E5ESQ5_9FIRM|nr:hypothetical protein DXB36_05060 [Dorea formicigenerans]
MPVSSALQFFQTLNTYSRLYPNKQAEVAQQLENLINGTTVPDTIIKKEKELLRALLIQFCKLEFGTCFINFFRSPQVRSWNPCFFQVHLWLLRNMIF